jgi:hypothetical protein
MSANQVFLEPDDEIRGQKFICLSFLSPEKVLKNKDVYFFSKFLDFFSLDYKVKATESFIMGQLRDMQNVLSDLHLDLENLNTGLTSTVVEFADLSGLDVFNSDISGSNSTLKKSLTALSERTTKTIKELTDKLTKARGTLTQKTGADLDTHVKTNMADFRESTIQEAYERYMVVNRQKLEDEFHAENKFRTTVRGLKCRGTYSTHEQATARAQQLHKKDPNFSVYVAEVGQWLPWDPEPDDIQEQQYGNEQLNTLMKSYRENATKRDEFFEEEKRQRMAEAASATKKPVFGERGKELEATEVVREIFNSPADLALQRKMEQNQEVIKHE